MAQKTFKITTLGLTKSGIAIKKGNQKLRGFEFHYLGDYKLDMDHINLLCNLIDGDKLNFIEKVISNTDYLPALYYLNDIIIRGDRYFKNLKDENLLKEVKKNRSILMNKVSILQEQYNKLPNDKKPKFYESEHFDNISNGFSLITDLFASIDYKIILLPGLEENELNKQLISANTLDEIALNVHANSMFFMQLNALNDKKGIGVFNVFNKINPALLRVDEWPAIVMWNNSDALFKPIKSIQELYNLVKLLGDEKRGTFNFLKKEAPPFPTKESCVYILHLSDLHFGNKDADKRKTRIVQIIKNRCDGLGENANIIPVITGDLVDSPDSKGVNSYNDFVYIMQLGGFKEPITILGNHDYSNKGISFNKGETKGRSLGQLYNQNQIHAIEELNLAFIKFDSNMGGKWAQGEVGNAQFTRLDNQIKKLKNSQELQFIALVHHHPVILEMPDNYKLNFTERLLGEDKFQKSMQLKDASTFLNWVKQHGIKYVLHGHKHIPNIHPPVDTVQIFAAGSSSGMYKHVDKNKTLMTYNILKYDTALKKIVSCMIYAEETLGLGEQLYRAEVF